VEVFRQFATVAAEKKGIFETLGIDWKILVLQIVAFLILVWLLGKFVYPWLMKSVDERQEKIEESVKAAQAAEAKAESAQEEIKKMLDTARKDAKDIIQTAKDEVDAETEARYEKARLKVEKMIADGHEQLEKDVIAARKRLHNDTIDLVALATEKVVGKAITDKVDDKVIAAAVKEAQ
jgi:F-type H+-transporting ATPase subunit b